ncbi:hypothetical protein [Stigmatella aurantiaca]|uniref:Conserved uncharacterized protein n=1 Tax=Stigmatella aurantiaca (strain DW4/3-1) TaxID=378806 RepID=Q08ZD8_STIAD|nr:hypothetical protein [Stigmatella aurantiaca]ADO75342.1 conserved uncharacterized protein [Stigmatella aurantiaca DW4/3-1]EAU65838.1 hypothetical protein STIAU_5707 [Stigmatella aurantiaca DW4/3-1]
MADPTQENRSPSLRGGLLQAGSGALHPLLDRSAAAGIPAHPLPGDLPLRRWVPQGAHSLLDYAVGLGVAGASSLSEAPSARRAGVALGLGLVGLSLLTDTRLSLSRLVPIELHALADCGWGLAALAAPFVGGYARRAPALAAVQAVAGAALLVASLLTDYRCTSGMHLGRERMTDLGPVGA